MLFVSRVFDLNNALSFLLFKMYGTVKVNFLCLPKRLHGYIFLQLLHVIQKDETYG